MTILFRFLLTVLHLGHWILQRSNLTAVVVVLEDEKALLVRSSYRPGWHLPGGFVDPPETFEAGARREALDELGFELLDLKLVDISMSRMPLGITNYCGVFVCSAFCKTQDRAANWEIEETSWFKVSALSDTANAFVQRCVGQACEVAKRA